MIGFSLVNFIRMEQISAVFRSTAFYVPERIVTNDDLTSYYETSDEWIFERSGIRERRFIDRPMGPSDLAVFAAKEALERAELDAEDIDMIVFSTLSPECRTPGSGCFLQAQLPFREIPAIDIRMQCSGFIFALSIAHQYIRSGNYKNILVVGSEIQSTSLDSSPEGRTVGVLFGDGCGVAIISAEKNENSDTKRGIMSTHLYSQGKYAKELWAPDLPNLIFPEHDPNLKRPYPSMNGREVFKHAVTRMSEVLDEAISANGWKIDEVAMIFPHQANARIVMAIADHKKIPMEKFFLNIHKYGNTTSASIPIAIAEAEREGKLKEGDKLVAMAFGSGFAWASAAIIW